MRSNGYEHFSPNTKRWAPCGAKNPDFCPFAEQGPNAHRPIGDEGARAALLSDMLPALPPKQVAAITSATTQRTVGKTRHNTTRNYLPSRPAAPAKPVAGRKQNPAHGYVVEHRADLLKNFRAKQAEVLAGKPVLTDGMPEHMVHSGTQIATKFQFANRIDGGYKPAKHLPVKNLQDDEITWTKPGGGLWISTLNEEGRSSWDELLYGYEDTPPEKFVQKTVTFKSSARVLVIDSLADYREILDRYPHFQAHNAAQVKQYADMGLGTTGMSTITADGKVKRGIDYEKLATNYDALILSWKGLYDCGRRDFRDDLNGDMSLYLYDIESAFVLNKSAIEVA